MSTVHGMGLQPPDGRRSRDHRQRRVSREFVNTTIDISKVFILVACHIKRVSLCAPSQHEKRLKRHESRFLDRIFTLFADYDLFNETKALLQGQQINPLLQSLPRCAWDYPHSATVGRIKSICQCSVFSIDEAALES